MAKDQNRPPHLCPLSDFAGVLDRNSRYRKDAWSRMRGTQMYDNYAATLATIKARDASQGRKDGRYKNGQLVKGKTQEQRAASFAIGCVDAQSGKLNFLTGATPYQNQAHHILVCEVFSEKKWTSDHLNVVKQVNYNINNPKNIIYLPQGSLKYEFRCNYHQLPNHAKGHNVYNQRILTDTQPLFNLVDQVVGDPNCEDVEDIRKKIYDKLIQIEKRNFKKLSRMGPKPLS